MTFSFCRRNVTALLAFTCLAACGEAPKPEPVVQKPERHIGPSDIPTQEIGDTAKFLAGVEGRADGPYHELEALPVWKAYRAKFDQTWATEEQIQMKPVATFQERALKGDKEVSRFLFYPFSGPDVLYMTRLFPGRAVYVMAGLEGVGHLPRVGEYNANNSDEHLNAWSTAMSSIFRRSFFVTSEMSKQLHGDSDGTLPIIVLLLTRAGYSVDAVELGQVGKDGAWEKPSAGRPRAVRVEFHTGEGPQQTLYYLSGNVATAFGDNAPLPAFLDKLGRPETFIKSASFLLHFKEFLNLRDYILRSSTRITQDDTGVRYQVLLEKGWKVRLYGEYSHPDKPFRPRFQPELETAFAEPGKVEPLGFSIGYGFNRRPSSLLVATPTH